MPAVRCPELGRRKAVPFRIEPECGQVAEDTGKCCPNKSGTVFHEDEAGSNLANDTGNVRPEPPIVFHTKPLAGGAERLAGESRSDAIHCATPWAAVEGGKVVPDRSVLQGRVRHPRHEDGRGVAVPFDCTHKSGAGHGELDAEFQASNAGAEGQHPEGM